MSGSEPPEVEGGAPREPAGGAASSRARSRRPFGRFLRGRGRITLQQLIDAVEWQRRQRPKVGAIAVERRLLSHAEVVEVLRLREPREPFLRTAVRLGLLTPEQARWVLANQLLSHRRIGEYFVERGLLTARELEEFLREHGRE
jgi:hypothetical protein